MEGTAELAEHQEAGNQTELPQFLEPAELE